jgi:hypothetical protein
MNLIEKALLDLHSSDIPEEILERAFVRKNINYLSRQIVNIDEIIKEDVIFKRVMTDCNVVGGVSTLINLDGLNYSKPSDYSYLFRIPKSLTSGRSIISVSKVVFLAYSASNTTVATGAYTTSMFGSGDSTSTMAASQSIMESYDNIPVLSTARVSKVAENTILIHDTAVLTPYCYLDCLIENDEMLNNFSMRSAFEFSELVLLAVKAEIWRRLVVAMDQNEIQSGFALGSFKTIVDSYSDAYKSYRDQLKIWMKVAFQSDDRLMKKFISMKFSTSR